MPQWYTRLEQCCAVYANVSLRRTLSVRSAVGDTAGNPLVRSLVLSTSAVVTTPAVAGGSGIGNGSSSAAIVGGTAARPGDDVIRATAVSVTDIDIDGVVQRLHTASGKPPVLPPSLADLNALAERALVSTVVPLTMSASRATVVFPSVLVQHQLEWGALVAAPGGRRPWTAVL